MPKTALFGWLLIYASQGSVWTMKASSQTGSNLNEKRKILTNQTWDFSFEKLARKASFYRAKLSYENSNVTQRMFTDYFNEGYSFVQLFQDSNGSIIDCNISSERSAVEKLVKSTHDRNVTRVTKKEMNAYVDLCEQRTVTIGRESRKILFQSSNQQQSHTFPGTNWCGFGNTSKNNNDLGFFRRTDKCCREHDRSLDNIPAFQTKHGITNRNLYTMTNCQDDCKFYNCLLNLRLLSSLFVGELFFNIISAKCFAYTYPNERNVSPLKEKCEWNQLGRPGPMKWRIFSPPNFWMDFLKKKQDQHEWI